MGSILHYADKGTRHSSLGFKHKALGFGINAVVEGGSGFGIGYLRGRYRDKKIGEHAPLIAAVAGKALGVVTMLAGHRKDGSLRPGAFLTAGLFDSVGGAGLALIGAEQGLKYGNKAAGVQAIVVQANAIPAGARQVSMGALGPAPEGEALTWDQMMQLRQMA